MPRNTDHIENQSAPQSAGMRLPSVEPTVRPTMIRNFELMQAVTYHALSGPSRSLRGHTVCVYSGGTTRNAGDRGISGSALRHDRAFCKAHSCGDSSYEDEEREEKRGASGSRTRNRASRGRAPGARGHQEGSELTGELHRSRGSAPDALAVPPRAESRSLGQSPLP